MAAGLDFCAGAAIGPQPVAALEQAARLHVLPLLVAQGRVRDRPLRMLQMRRRHRDHFLRRRTAAAGQHEGCNAVAPPAGAPAAGIGVRRVHALLNA